MDYSVNGVPIGYKGPRSFREHDNWPSAYKFSHAVTESIQKDIFKGRKLAFDQPPSTNFVGSPMGAFQKKRSEGKYRVIHDLSWPPGGSINDFISSEDYSLQYMSVADVADRVIQLGEGCYLAKLDLEDAFKHIPVRKEDWELLGTTWYKIDQDGNRVKQYLLDTVLPFGLRSSPKLFDDFASALEYIMVKRGVTYVRHYLDDFVTLHKSREMCDRNLEMMLQICAEIGFAVNSKKVTPANTETEFLGIVIDTNNMELKISEDRLCSVLSELYQWYGKETCTKRQLLSIIGKLTFVSRVVKSGKTFVRRLIQLSKKAKYLHHRLTITDECRKDFEWWLSFLPRWNGISIIHDACWFTSADLELYTDASNVAIGAYCQGSWFVEPFTGETALYALASINWRELYALVKAAATWAGRLANKRVLFYCDNISVVHIIQNGTSRVPEMMDLVRALFFICERNNIECACTHITTTDNNVADALSRLQFTRFWELDPNADVCMTQPKSIAYN